MHRSTEGFLKHPLSVTHRQVNYAGPYGREVAEVRVQFNVDAPGPPPGTFPNSHTPSVK